MSVRKLILDTETTGLDYENDRIIECACLELIDDHYTEKRFHSYYNPGGVVISQQSEEIHGLSNAFLTKFKTFEDSIDNFLEFVGDSQIIAHNAQFDISMINSALKRKNKDQIDMSKVLCTLELAKKKFPGSKNNLNALCRRFNVSLESREKHGALTDCYLLMRVYFELMGGKQELLSFKEIQKEIIGTKTIDYTDREKIIFELSDEEKTLHQKMLEKITKPIWNF